MQIEETFRDTKSKRFGFALEESGTKTSERMSVLLLIDAICTFACWLSGLFIQAEDKAKDFQAHSAIKSKFCCKFPFSKTPIFMSV
jgi:hypothetical protein